MAFSIDELPLTVTFLVVVAIVGGLGGIILDDMKNSGSYSTEVNATLDAGVDAVEEIAGWLDIIALVVSAVIILGLIFAVMNYVRSRTTGGGGDFY